MSILFYHKQRQLSKLLYLLLILILTVSCNKKEPEGKFISFGDYELYVQDWGQGEPSVIIEGGLNCKTYYYDRIQEAISDCTRVISYDHAGIGKSTPNSNPRTLPYYLVELRALLDSTQLPPPYILIGHSLGGHMIRYFAHFYPDEVAGLVFIDHPHEDWFRYIRETWTSEENKKYFEWWDPNLNEDFVETAAKELFEYEANCDSIRGKVIPPNIPVLMFTGNNVLHFRSHEAGLKEDQIAWAEMQHSLIEHLDTAKQIVDLEAGHAFQNDKPELVNREILSFIQLVKHLE